MEFLNCCSSQLCLFAASHTGTQSCNSWIQKFDQNQRPCEFRAMFVSKSINQTVLQILPWYFILIVMSDMNITNPMNISAVDFMEKFLSILNYAFVQSECKNPASVPIVCSSWFKRIRSDLKFKSSSQPPPYKDLTKFRNLWWGMHSQETGTHHATGQ